MDFNLGLFFDHFGFLLWIFLIWFAVYYLKKTKKARWQKYTMLIIGLLGILVDGTLLIGFYANWQIVAYAWFFDNFGIIVFLFLLYCSITELRNKEIKKKYAIWLLFLISTLGLLADGFILIKHYFN